MTKQLTTKTTTWRARTVGKWLVLLIGGYVVLRLAVAIAVPAMFIDREWVLSIKMKCLERQDLCRNVQVENAVVGKLWWGKAFYFAATPGRAGELKAFVVKDMPIGKVERMLTPWNYVGAQFTEN